MNLHPLVSVCLPIYKVEQYIERCVRSLLEQTYDNIEFVFVNDCTPDQSIEILQSVVEQYPQHKKQVKIVHHEMNRGTMMARNTAVEHATGEFILWVDSDDYIAPETVEKTVMKQMETGADIVCYNFRYLFANGLTHTKHNKEYGNGKNLCLCQMLGKAPMELCGHLIRRRLYTDNNIQSMEKLTQGEDFCHMIMLAYHAGVVATVHEALYIYDKTRETSASHNFCIKSSCDIRKVFTILHQFFADKEPEFSKALDICHLNSIINRIVRFSLSSAINDAAEYTALLTELDGIDHCYYRNLKLSLRLIPVLRSRSRVKYYCYLLNTIKSILRK